VSFFLAQVAFALAAYLMGAEPGERQIRAVAFLLGVPGHRRAGLDERTARKMYARSRLLAKGINQALRERYSLDYDPLDIVEFNSFDELLKKRPAGGAVWGDILILTHASGEQAREFTGEIFFGKENFVVNGSGTNDLIDAINARPARVRAFREGFDDRSNITLIGCGVGATGPDVGAYVRVLFDVDGQITFPIKNVDLLPNGQPGTPVDPERPRELRPLKPEDWQTLPRRDDMLDAAEPVRP
jgi:hypothetical protein